LQPSLPPPRAVRARDAAALALFVLFWLVPITYHGFHGGERMPGWPYPLLHLTNVSCLFKGSVPVWFYDYVQVQPGAGRPWVTLDESEYFQMPAFGHRTRMDELFRRQLGDRALQEMLSWIRRRYHERHPGEPAPTSVRVVSGHFRVGDPIPPGHWRKPPLAAVPADRQQAWYELRFGRE
jgi:hypothetical protein